MKLIASSAYYARLAYTAVADLIAPPVCAYCKIFLSTHDVLCVDCKNLVLPVTSIAMPICKEYTLKLFAVSGYHDPLRALILAKMWGDVRSSTILGELICSHTPVNSLPIDCFVPIPLHWTRYASRGFNQAEQMCYVLSKKIGKPTVSLLSRTRRTVFQSLLKTNERNSNVKGVFKLREDALSLYQGKHIVLVDDLMTTGSTLQAAAKELAKCKPASITALVACRVI